MSITIHTIERKPRVASAQPPLLVMLHGYGSNEHDLFSMADELDPRLHIVSARGMLALPWGGYAWYHLGGAPGNLLPDPQTRALALDLLVKFIEAMPARVGSDPRRTYLFGFSQGSVMSLALATRIPEQLAGVIAVSGYLDPDLSDGQPPAGLDGLPILQMHGTYDDVIPVTAAHKTRDILALTQADHIYREYPIGHNISLEGLQLIQQWLEEQLDDTH